ncbi:MAG: HPr family phosphocarrier protein [Sedimentisphaerales bacterium]|nr:HPr family phosphocarrier protein [Sedimentisphaerales bacterium]
MTAQESTRPGGGLRTIRRLFMNETAVPEASRRVTIENSLGLHMRPTMQFVDLANQFRARVLVRKGNHAVDGKNPMEMMLLEAVRGTELDIQATGADAADAVEALAALVKSGFGEQ